MPDFGPLVIDVAGRRVTLDGTEVPLTRSEFALLNALAANPGAAMSNRDILEAMWGTSWEADTTPLQVHVSRLRRKLGESGQAQRYIVTIHGFGYRFEPDPEGSHGPPSSPDNGTNHDDEPVGTQVSVLMSKDRTIQWVSDSVHDLLGWSPQDLVGTSARDLVHPDDLVDRPEEQELNRGRAQLVAGRMRKASGEYREVTASAHPVIDATGAVTGLLVEWRPIEATAANGAPAPIKLALEPSPEPESQAVTLTYDRELVLRDISPRVPIGDWDPDEIIGTVFSIPGLDQQASRTMVATLIQTGTWDPSGPIDVRCKDGSVLPATAEAHIDVDEHGLLTTVHMTLHLPSG